MNWFWHALWICLFVIPITILWAACVFDMVWRRRELVWWKRLAWLLLVILVPVIGALIYASVALSGDSGMHPRGDMTDVEYQQQRERMYAQGRS